MQITTIIVTYNRKALLLRCLAAVAEQTKKPNRIIIVENASTDGTLDLLQSEGWLSRPDVELLALNDNIGGAGGFSTGLKHAAETGAKWVWMMDDDGYPEINCLEKLADTLEKENIDAISPIQVDITNHTKPAFPIRDKIGKPILSLPQTNQHTTSDNYIPSQANLFNGLLIGKDTINKIGLPREELFIRGDEVEFTRRMIKHQISFGTLTSAFFFHPSDRHERFKILAGAANARDAGSDFKNYYMYRNKAVAFREENQLWLIPFDFVRYVYYFLIFKRWDWTGLKLWLKATNDGLHGRLGRHPNF